MVNHIILNDKRYNPYFIHFPGYNEKIEEIRIYDLSINKLINNKIFNCIPENIDFLTFSDEKTLLKNPILIEQFKTNNIPINILTIKKWEGNINKIFLLKEYMDNDISKNEYIIFLDSMDCLLYNELEDILSIYNSKFDNTILFSKEIMGLDKNCGFFWDSDYARMIYNSDNVKLYFDSLYKNSYLNSGMCISRKEVLYKHINNLYKLAIELNNNKDISQKDDQSLWSYYVSKNKIEDIILDEHNIFFLNIVGYYFKKLYLKK